MASETRSTTDPVAALAALLDRAYAFDFFEAMRRVECAWPEMPRLGTATRPADEPVRLGQQPSLDFAPSMLASAAVIPGNRLRILGYFLGLYGPHGPLPLHLTEYVHDRIVNARDGTLAAFTDIFHHRMLELFYRAWANSRPTVAFDRPEADQFAFYVAALIGVAGPGMRDRDAWPDRAKLYFSGLLSSATKTRAGLESLLSDYLGFQVQVEECIGEWVTIHASERMRLGDRETATLGSCVLGERAWSAQHKARLRIGPLDVDDLLQYRPGGDSLNRLRALVLNYLGIEYAWDVQFVVRRTRLPAIQLGEFGHLGWSSWLAPPASGGNLDDVIIDMSEPLTAA